MLSKELIIETIKNMPEEQFEDIDVLFERIVILEKIEKGERDILKWKSLFHRRSKGKAQKMAVIKWTETALNDTDNIAEYISLDSVFYARQFIQKILNAAQKLEKFPEIGKIVPELPGYNYREILFKKYRIIYRVELDVVYIISVHHSSRLLENNEHFKNLFE